MRRTWLIASTVAVAVLLGTFWAGRASRGVQVQVKEVERKVIDTKASERLNSTLDELQQARKDLATWQTKYATADAHVDTKVIWRYLPGKVVEVTKETTSDTHKADTASGGSKDTSTASKDTKSTGTKELAAQTQTIETHTVERVPVLPNWHAEALLGIQRSSEKAFPLYGPLVGGAVLSHRFISSSYVGGWIGTFGGLAGGASFGGNW